MKRQVLYVVSLLLYKEMLFSSTYYEDKPTLKVFYEYASTSFHKLY